MNKQFKDVKPGDKIYKVCVYDYKTRIITKKVKDIKHKGECRLTILCECKDSEYYANLFPRILSNESIHKDKFTSNTYICSNIEDAKIVCRRLSQEIITKAEKEVEKLNNRINKWRSHTKELYEGNYIIV